MRWARTPAGQPPGRRRYYQKTLASSRAGELGRAEGLQLLSLIWESHGARLSCQDG
jgi:hypothetical protein